MKLAIVNWCIERKYFIYIYIYCVSLTLYRHVTLVIDNIIDDPSTDDYCSTMEANNCISIDTTLPVKTWSKENYWYQMK